MLRQVSQVVARKDQIGATLRRHAGRTYLDLGSGEYRRVMPPNAITPPDEFALPYSLPRQALRTGGEQRVPFPAIKLIDLDVQRQKLDIRMLHLEEIAKPDLKLVVDQHLQCPFERRDHDARPHAVLRAVKKAAQRRREHKARIGQLPLVDGDAQRPDKLLRRQLDLQLEPRHRFEQVVAGIVICRP